MAMPVGKSGLNTNNKFVYLMEEVYMENRKLLYSVTRKGVRNQFILAAFHIFIIITMIMLTIYTKTVIMISFHIMVLALAISEDILIRKIINRILQQNDIKHTDGMIFDKNYNILEINESDVLNTTFKIDELNGNLHADEWVFDTLLRADILINIAWFIVYLLFTYFLNVSV